MTAFREWRRGRPFWGGLLLVLSGLEMFLSANMSLDNIEIHIGPQGFLSYLIPTMMLISGALVWLSPAQRLFYGVIGTLTALYSFIGLNLGGWIAGMILGIVGGALVIAWSAPPATPVHDSGEPTTEFPPVVSDPAIVPGLDDQDPSLYAGEPRDPAQPGHGAAGPDRQAGDPGPRHRSMRRKALILIAPLLLATAVIGGGNDSADAAPECPKGMPSRTATPSADAAKKAAAAKVAAAKKKKAAAKKAAEAGPPAKASPSATAKQASPSPSASASEAEKSDTPILDGINDIIEDINDGLNDIFNPGEEPTPAPTSAAPSAGPSATPTSVPATTPSATPSTKPSTGPSAEPATSSKPEEIPCLGPRQEGLIAEADGLPRAGVKPGILKTDSLTMYNSTYEGVVDVPTANGPIKSLFFSMDKAVNKPFSLAIAEPNGKTTLIKSGQLTTDGNVEFYSPKFEGKLFGLIPVTFTPEQPPPLTLPVLWFTDVTIDLAYVQCDVLTAKPISISEI